MKKKQIKLRKIHNKYL